MSYNTIVLKGKGIQKEAVAAGSITPGMLVALNSAGKVAAHATGGGVAQRAFAVEYELGFGSYSTGYKAGGINDAYSANDNVKYVIAERGDEIYALVAAGASAIVAGDLLESNGAGGFRKVTAASQLTSANYTYTPAGTALAVAMEAVDNSGGSSVARIKVEVL